MMIAAGVSFPTIDQETFNRLGYGNPPGTGPMTLRLIFKSFHLGGIFKVVGRVLGGGGGRKGER